MPGAWRLPLGLIAIGVFFFVPFAAAKDEYPTKPIEIFVGFAPGGATDTVIRVIAPPLQKNLGVSVVIVNKPGASGSVAAKQVSHAVPDGYTLLCVPIQHTIFPAITANPPYSIQDFEPIGRLVTSPMVIMVNPNSPWKTLDELIEHARKNPAKLKAGVAGVGSVGNMIFEIIKRKANIEIIQMPFTSEIDALTAVLGGHADFCANSLGISTAHIKSGRLKALAATCPKRFPLIPEIPTVAELGYPEAAISTYVGMLAPRKVPKERLTKLYKVCQAAITDSEAIASLEKVGFVADYLNAPDFQKFLVTHYEQFRKIAEEAKIVVR